MSVEDKLHTVGDAGRYQLLMLALISFTFVLQSVFGLVNVFFTMSSDHYCRVYTNQSYELDSPLKRATIPRTHHENQTVWDSCHMYNVNESMLFDSYLADGTASNMSRFTAMGVHPCDHGWVFDRSSVSNTLVMEFNLVCDGVWLQQLPKSTYAFAGIFGSVIFGPLSDACRNGDHEKQADGTGSPFICLSYLILDESPRWLFQQGKLEETEKLFEKIAKWNKTTYKDKV
ncbi:solute carrier family 22 member 6-B-like [Ptychodera flava]|uniref:solute carrier family 22 member 6-B-like n=1 Tax=Ptychodera flava TaxID=63121 RepID=UPI00396A639E